MKEVAQYLAQKRCALHRRSSNQASQGRARFRRNLMLVGTAFDFIAARLRPTAVLEMKMNRFSVCGAIGLFLTGCTGSAVITDLTQDKVAVQATYASQTQVREEARRGCAMHGRRAVPVSDQCLDSTCTSQSFLFACRGPLGYSDDSTPSWLGMSVDDVSGHLYAASPGSTAVVITRIYADGPAKEAGLEVGDVIESFNGILVRNSFTLVDLKKGIAVGKRVPLGIRRGNEKRRVVITAETRP